jgi:signal transduction protein with GAF and PtsI domain
VDDAQNDPRLAPIHDLMRQRGTVSFFTLPLIVGSEVVGSLGLEATEPRHFSTEEVSLAWSVADQVAGALAWSVAGPDPATPDHRQKPCGPLALARKVRKVLDTAQPDQ